MKKAIFVIIFGLLLSGNAYAGCIQGDCNNGYGTFIDSFGNKYVGEFKNGNWHGQGTGTAPNGNTYVGGWKDGLKHGHGTYTWAETQWLGGRNIDHIKGSIPAGSKYVGEYKDGYPHGQGTITYTDGTEKFAIWKKGKIKTIISEKKTIVEKPEKKEPKSNPDDNKVVAASSGSGFFVTRTGHLVTNYHVVEECDAVKVSFNAKEIQADTIAIDKYNDLAIIKANINPSKVFPVSKEDVSLLQEVIVAGFPLGKKISALIKTHKGNVSALAGIGDNYSNFQTDATINHGNSGGPILTQKGNVIGVAVQLIPPDKAQNVFFGVKSSTLNTFAKANNVSFLPPNNREMTNAELGQLITEATVFLECWMTVAKIKQLIAQEENRKAFYSKFK